ncbi:hypothetical protein RJ641_002861 [Dillenia turbinata]|uniref:Uncharacterized protein n=1 Tax=Dillenia turbinata TaxID=194707 RepID=A0AAN8ZES1_9MAGN
MKTWVYEEYCSVDVLKFESIVIVPEVKDEQVLIKVAAAAALYHGKFKAADSPLPIVKQEEINHIISSQFRNKRPPNKEEKDYAEYTAVEEKMLALKPKNLDFAQAAGLPLAVETAHEGLERLGFSAGKSILVLGGAGGVGSLVIQKFPEQVSTKEKSHEQGA